MRRALFCLFILVLVAFSQSDLPQLNYKADAEWPQLPTGTNFVETPAVSVDPAENVYVFHRGNPPILVFDKTGKFLRGMGLGLFESPHGLRVGPDGSLWAVDNGAHFVVKLDASGRVRMVLGQRRIAGEAENLFNRPTDVAIAPNGDIYVSDGYGNSRVAQFSQDGKFVRAWGKRGVKAGEFNTPHAVVLDKQGKLYVADRENFRIQIFDREGKFQQMWTHVGSPWGLALTDDGMLFMADGYNNRILKLDLDGKIIGAIGEHGKLPGQFNLVHHIAVAPSGNLYAGEITNLRAQRFVAVGSGPCATS